MKINWGTSLLFYPILLGFFCLDLDSSFIFNHNLFATVLVLLAVMLARPLNIFRIALIIFFLSLESFFFYGRSYLFLIYAIPVCIMIFNLRDRFWDQFSCMVVTLLMALAGQYIVLEYYMLDGRLFSIDHLLGIIVNILFLMLITVVS